MKHTQRRGGQGGHGPARAPFRGPPMMVDLASRPDPFEATFADFIVRGAAIPGCRDLAAAVLSERTGHLMLRQAVVAAGDGVLAGPARVAIPAFMSIHLPMLSMWVEFRRHDRQYGIHAERLADGRLQLRHATRLSSNSLATPIALTLLDTRAGVPAIDGPVLVTAGRTRDEALDQRWIEWLSTVMRPVLPPGRILDTRQRERWQSWALQDMALLAVALSPQGRFQ